jgi:HTH-type transcriptional regulator / antitoxin HigA
MKIESNSQYHSKIESYIEKGFKKLSKKETEDLKFLSIALEEYELHKYPMPIRTGIKEILETVMLEQKINKTQLAKTIEMPNSTLNDILSGKKKINISIARTLHQKLKIDGNFLLEVA